MLWMSRNRLRLAVLWATAAASALAAPGCGKKEAEDPYVYGSLRAVTRGGIQSKTMLFEIDAPEFVFAKGDAAIVRDGNLLEIMVLRDAENRAASLSGKILGVEKRYSPFVHLVAKRVKDGTAITALDSVPNPVLPRLIPTGDIDLAEIPGFDLKELKWNGDAEKLGDRLDSQFQTVGRIVYRPDPEAALAAKEAGAATSQAQMAWFLLPAQEGDSMLKISNVTPQLEFAARLLEAENLPFVGAATLKEVYDLKKRRDTKITGKVEIGWMRYANRFMGA